MNGKRVWAAGAVAMTLAVSGCANRDIEELSKGPSLTFTTLSSCTGKYADDYCARSFDVARNKNRDRPVMYTTAGACADVHTLANCVEGKHTVTDIAGYIPTSMGSGVTYLMPIYSSHDEPAWYVSPSGWQVLRNNADVAEPLYPTAHIDQLIRRDGTKITAP